MNIPEKAKSCYGFSSGGSGAPHLLMRFALSGIADVCAERLYGQLWATMTVGMTFGNGHQMLNVIVLPEDTIRRANRRERHHDSEHLFEPL